MFRRFRHIAVLAALGIVSLLDAGAAADAPVHAAFDDDCRSFAIHVPNVMDLRAGYSATVELGGLQHVLLSTTGVVVEASQDAREETPYGVAAISASTIHFKDEQVDLHLRLGRLDGISGVVLQAGVRNRGEVPLKLVGVSPLQMAVSSPGRESDDVAWRLDMAGDAKKWVFTCLDRSAGVAPPVFVPGGKRKSFDVHEYGTVYRSNGDGFLFGPVGEPIAFVDSRFEYEQGQTLTMSVSAEMGGVRVAPGATCWGQQVVLLVEPPQQALRHWTEWVAATHGSRTSMGALSGWNSWNFKDKATAGAELQAMVAEVQASAGRLRPDVIQVETGFKDAARPAEVSFMFPEGLKFYADRIATTGARPGIFLQLQPSGGGRRYADQQSWDRLVANARWAVRNGFTFLKVHCTGVTIRPGAYPDKTPFAVFREGFERVREAVGDETCLVYVDRQPSRATVGLVDSSRTGVNALRKSVRNAIDDLLRSCHLNGRWFTVDGDMYYMGTQVENLSKVSGGWPLVRTWLSMVGLSGGMAVTSDPWHWDSFKPYWRNVEVLAPPARERAEVLDLGTARKWPRLVGHVVRDWGSSTVALLWNPSRSEQTISLEFEQAGMDPNRRYAVWSFWENRYLGIAEKSWTTRPLASAASQHLRFTPLKQSSSKPVLIGSNLHIYCGASDIARVVSSSSSMQIELTDAGARDGDLFIYSRTQPVLMTASGCAVTGVSGAGEYVWRVSIMDRQNGVPQRIVLKMLLPVRRQAWFWMLIAGLALSLALAAWRYVVGLRLQRAHDLDLERARISRDIHDDLGATLTRIVMLSDAEEGKDSHLQQIHEAALDMTREMDATVWAINPRNDSLDQLVLYLDAYAQEFLDPTGIESRVEFPDSLPAVPVKAHVRHTVFLAFKEALANIVHHADARLVQLRLSVQSTGFQLVVEDDGAGFVERPETPPRPDTGNGLRNMRQRLSAIGGRCLVDSEPGRGTRVTFEVPLEG